MRGQYVSAICLAIAASGLTAQIVAPPATVDVTSAASFVPGLAPDSLASLFGPTLADELVVGGLDLSGALPTELGGVSVEINGTRCGLFFVAPGQINFHIPATVGLGPAEVTVLRGSRIIGRGATVVKATAPGLFSLDSTGRGRGAILNAVTNRLGPFEATTPENLLGRKPSSGFALGT